MLIEIVFFHILVLGAPLTNIKWIVTEVDEKYMIEVVIIIIIIDLEN